MFARIKKRLPKLLLELVLLMVLVVAFEAYLTRDAVSGQAPPLSGTTVSGKSFSLDSLKGQPAVVYFWATWCPVCNLEQGMVDSLAAGYPVITVAMQSGTDQEIVDYLKDKGVDYPVLNDPQGSIARRYGVSGVPASFILDSKGEVRFVTRGYTSGLGIRLRLWLAGVMG